jgi:hypothetical protein
MAGGFQAVWDRVKNEPAVILGLVGSIVVALTTTGGPVTWAVAVPIVVNLILRQLVSPVDGTLAEALQDTFDSIKGVFKRQ